MPRWKSFPYFLAHVKRLNWLHWFYAAMISLLSVYFLHETPNFVPVGAICALLVVFNGLFSYLYRRIEKSRREVNQKYDLLRRVAFIQVFLDCLLALAAIHFTGGYISPVPLNFIIYFGTLATFMPPFELVSLVVTVILLYSGMMYGYIAGVFTPYIPLTMTDVVFSVDFMEQLGLVYVGAMLLTGALVWVYSNQNQKAWIESDEQSNYLHELHNLTRISLGQLSLSELYELLAKEAMRILHARAVYISRVDDETGQVYSAAVSQADGSGLPPSSRFERTLTKAVRSAGKTVLIENTQMTPYISPQMAAMIPPQAMLANPMYGFPDNRFQGVISVAYEMGYEFTPEVRERAMQVADTAALLISRARLYEETQRRADLLEKLAGQITTLTSDLNRTTLLSSIVESARSLLHAERAALYLYDMSTRETSCAYSVGLSEYFLENLAKRVSQLPGAQVFSGQDFVLIPDVQQDSRTSPLQDLIGREKFRAYAVFGLPSPNGPLGALTLYWDLPHAISSEEIAVGRLFAERAGALLHSSSLVERIAEESLTDALTGLPNRRSLDQRIAMEVERSNRYGKPFCLLMIDLNGFKSINDNFGHQIGDSVLRQVSASLYKTVRASDYIARYGGDEFAVILPEAEEDKAEIVIDKLRMALAATKLHLPNETQRYLSACVGIACFPKDAKIAEALFLCADQRLYEAKRKRKQPASPAAA